MQNCECKTNVQRSVNKISKDTESLEKLFTLQCWISYIINSKALGRVQIMLENVESSEVWEHGRL